MVYSFYPLYTEKDLFENDILTGTWIDGDSAQWKFEHPYKGKELPENLDKTSIVLMVKDKNDKEAEFRVQSRFFYFRLGLKQKLSLLAKIQPRCGWVGYFNFSTAFHAGLFILNPSGI